MRRTPCPCPCRPRTLPPQAFPKNFPAPENFKPGTLDERFLHGVDLAPTMIDIAGAPKPAKMQGHIFLGPRTEPPQPSAIATAAT